LKTPCMVTYVVAVPTIASVKPLFQQVKKARLCQLSIKQAEEIF
jgi:hypothetical protein